MIRRDVSISLGDISAADVRAAIDAHRRSLSWTGDSYMGKLWLNATHRSVLVDGEPVGVVGWSADDGGKISLLTLARRALPLDRQVAEFVLTETGVRTAFVASWDAHHMGLFGAFASGIGSQAYLFRLFDRSDLREPLPGMELARATADDLQYLESTGWRQDYAKFVNQGAMSVVRQDGREVGIAVHEPHVLDPSIVDVGMFVEPELRRRGIGRSIIALTAQQVLDEGRTPVAGCWWKNWSSRATLEAAGFVCAGTIFRWDLDPDMFVEETQLGNTRLVTGRDN